MLNFIKYLVIGLFGGMVIACASTPLKTMNERRAFVEISYQEVLSTAILWRSEGRLSDSQQKQLTSLFNQVDNALQVMDTAIATLNVTSFNDGSKMALDAITAVRQILVAKESKPSVSTDAIPLKEARVLWQTAII